MSVVLGEVVVEIKTLLRQAYQVAETFSTDKSTHVGALLYDPFNEKVLTCGWNTFTDKSQLLDSRNHLRPRKYAVTEHAERFAIYEAARKGIATTGLTLICPWASCPDCARAIVLSGIIQVIGHFQAFEKTPERWKTEIEIGLEILEGGGVEYKMYDGNISDVRNLFNGEFWYP